MADVAGVDSCSVIAPLDLNHGNGTFPDVREDGECRLAVFEFNASDVVGDDESEGLSSRIFMTNFMLILRVNIGDLRWQS